MQRNGKSKIYTTPTKLGEYQKSGLMSSLQCTDAVSLLIPGWRVFGDDFEIWKDMVQIDDMYFEREPFVPKYFPLPF
jgi:hypothetical protein